MDEYIAINEQDWWAAAITSATGCFRTEILPSYRYAYYFHSVLYSLKASPSVPFACTGLGKFHESPSDSKNSKIKHLSIRWPVYTSAERSFLPSSSGAWLLLTAEIRGLSVFRHQFLRNNVHLRLGNFRSKFAVRYDLLGHGTPSIRRALNLNNLWSWHVLPKPGDRPS